MDEFNYYSDSETSYNEEAIYERNANEEADREAYMIEEEKEREKERIQQASETRKAAYEEKLKAAIAMGKEESQYLISNSIRKYNTLKKAIEAKSALPNSHKLVLFARDVPKRNDKKMRVDYKKQYLIGSPSNLYSYASSVNFQIQLDEVVEVTEPSPFHFDVEIKASDVETDEKLVEVLVGLCGSFGLEDHTHDEMSKLYYEYVKISKTDFTEGVCRAGLAVIKEHILEVFSHLPEVDATELSIRVVSGCRKKKFSLHLVMDKIYCESAVLSMALVVFEIARKFSVENMRWLLEHNDSWNSDIGEFRIRALMIKEMGQFVNIEEGNPKYTFSGYNDTPFDEAIYAKNHLLRAPGACKLSGWVGGLHPIAKDDDKLMREEFHFNNMFEDRFIWKSYLIQCGCEPEDCRVICGYEPTDAYPSKYRFVANQVSLGTNTSEEGLRLTFKKVSKPYDIEPNKAMERLLGSVYEEKRLTYKKHRQMTVNECENARRDITQHPRLPVYPNTCFRSGEDGRLKPFRLFVENEFLHHVHNGVEESTASAKVFVGGFHCFGCNETFAVPKSAIEEDGYEFYENEIQRDERTDAYLKPFNWKALLEDGPNKKKWHVISAPMGSGKTHQMLSLVNDALSMNQHNTICCVSFRVFLATQQAQRLGMTNYRECGSISTDPPDQLVIVVNSLVKLVRKVYNIVILDECGFIRRHFLSRTMKDILGPAYNRFVQLIKCASTVVLLQDGISRDDVQFYTDIDGVDCDDRNQIVATQFIKPRRIHPIKYSENFAAATHMMVQSYRRSFIRNTDGEFECTQPFMVFCSSLMLATFFTKLLKKEAVDHGWAQNRIHGIWSSVKEETEFARNFSRDPNRWAKEADVVVCTSVVGAGFSITHHFGSFHAFLSLNILTHTEETQFVQRLRYVMDELRDDSERQSYIYVEKGHGPRYEYTDVLESFDVVRKLLYRNGDHVTNINGPVSNLDITHARIVTERANTRAMHVQLWEGYAQNFLQSEFVMYEVEESEYEWVVDRFKKYKKKNELSIASLVRNQCESDRNEEINISESIMQMEQSDSLAIFRIYDASAAKNQVENIKDCFRSRAVGNALINNLLKPDQANKMLANKHKLSTFVNLSRRLALWILWSYKSLIPRDRTDSLFGSLERYSPTWKALSIFHVADHFLPKLFSVATDVRIPYVIDRSTMPFYSGATVNNTAANSLGAFFKSELENQPNDTDEIKAKKDALREHIKHYFNQHSRTQTELRDIYRTGDKSKAFLRRLLQSIGLKLKCSNTRIRGSDTRKTIIETPKVPMTMLFGVKKLSNYVCDLLPTLLSTQNLHQDDKVWIKECIENFNGICKTNHRDRFVIKTDEDNLSIINMSIQQRLAEDQLLDEARANTLEAEDAPVDRRTQFEVQARLNRLRERAERVYQEDLDRAHETNLSRADNEIIQDEIDIDIEEENENENERANDENLNPYIENEAEEND